MPPIWRGAPLELPDGQAAESTDASVLPRSTGMRLAGSMIPGTTRPEEAVFAARTRAKGASATFIQSIPCLGVRNIDASLAFYSGVMSFVRVGPKNASRVLIFRGAPGVGASAANQKAPGVRLVLRATSERPSAQEVHIGVSNVDAVFAECAKRLLAESQTRTEYFPHTYLGAA
ncbi:hypothetical protein MCUN1_002366 [Malassezia cuniculi]|uniref:VOC domain-containing protein n=1 Tax=Malassezia cuniculi TaxID=948313 RepID=A0AAF0ERF2_9BASI|nr:hypothetical protein MCUN1_002366 [Malassezia cuniculi]